MRIYSDGFLDSDDQIEIDRVSGHEVVRIGGIKVFTDLVCLARIYAAIGRRLDEVAAAGGLARQIVADDAFLFGDASAIPAEAATDDPTGMASTYAGRRSPWDGEGVPA